MSVQLRWERTFANCTWFPLDSAPCACPSLLCIYPFIAINLSCEYMLNQGLFEQLGEPGGWSHEAPTQLSQLSLQEPRATRPELEQ